MTWVAEYVDGTSLMQFSNEGKEFQFSDITQDKLERFSVVVNNKGYSVNVNKGELNLNGLKLSFKESRLTQHRLIYFRRIRKTIGTSIEKDNSNVTEFIGFQSKVNGENVKRLFAIKNDGTLIQE
jgi:hypothetical protein